MGKERSVAILLPTLDMGGAEKGNILLAPALMAAGWQVTFVLYRAEGVLLESVPQGARMVSLQANSTKAALLPLIHFLRREKPAILIANLSHTNLVAIIAKLLACVPTRLIVTFHNALSQECKVRGDGRIVLWACRILLPFADAIITVSQGVAKDLISSAWVALNKVQVIYNPVVDKGFSKRSEEPIPDRQAPFLLGVGRLVEQKDFATLIHAFSLIEKNIPHTLIIIGDGELKLYLNKLIDELHLSNKVKLVGHITNPLPYMHAASVGVLSSRYEGLGNVLIEALACGTPVVSTDCPYGPAEILENGRWGKLVPVGGAEAMAQAIEETLRSQPDRAALQKRGREFSVQAAALHYCELLEKLYIPMR